MHDNLSGRAAELAHLNDLIRSSLSLTDAALPLLNEQLHALLEMGIDKLEFEGPRISHRTADWLPTFNDKLPPIVRAMISGVAPKLIAGLLSSFHVLAR